MQNLDDLVSQAENIATNLEDDEVPHIQRNIEQLRKRGETFYNRAAQNDIKAAKLLGNKVGYELSAGLSKTLESLNVISSHDGVSPINIEDIPSFLKNERETAILSSINLTRNNTLNTSYKLCEQAKSDWWKNEKNNILNLLMNSDKLPNLMPISVTKGTTVKPGENSRFVKSSLSKEEILYAREMAKYVDNLVSRSEFAEQRSLLNMMLQADSSPINAGKCNELVEISRLLARYCGYRPTCGPSQLAEARDTESGLSRALVDAALQHMEAEYWLYVQQCVQGVVRDAPGDARRYLATFVETQLLPQLDTSGFEDGTVAGVPVWPLIFTCLRAGLHDEAILVARDAASNLRDLHSYLETWVAMRGSLPTEQARKLSTEYKRHVRASSDSCKRLVFSLLAGCDVDETHGVVLTSVDDFMWLRLVHVNRCIIATQDDQQQAHVTRSRYSLPGEPQHGQMHQQQHHSLAQLQKLISEDYGESHFQANQQPLTFCRILLLCQLFEPALAFLARFDTLRCHAAHLALTLWESNLLLVAPSLDCPLLSRCEEDPQGLSRLNLMRLVTLYTRKFESSHPKEALDLFFVLSELQCDRDDFNGFVTCASSLAVESGQLEVLFGRTMGDDGYSHAGLLTRYGPVSETILEAVARRYRQTGQTESACDALQLAGRLQEAATDLAELLANALSLPSTHPTVSRLQAKCESTLSRMPECAESALLSRVLTVTRFSYASADGDTETALSLLDSTQLLPTSSDAGTIRSATEAFRGLPELVRSLFPNLLVAAMRTLRSAALSRYTTSLTDIRRRAAALITFTGQLPYRMPSEVYASLSQLELEIN